MTDEQADGAAWWGSLPLQVGRTTFRRVGPLQLWLSPGEGELSVAVLRGSDPLDPVVELAAEPPEIPELAERHRFAVPANTTELTLGVALPDRPVVVRPDRPLHVPAGMETTLSVSVPTWFRLEVPGLARPLLDWPTWRPSDTWFGPSVREGELCYASRTQARIGTDLDPGRPTRARCRLLLRNSAEDELLVDRISLPVPRLTLYARGSRLHAGSLDVTLQPGGSSVEVAIRRGPPEGQDGAVLLAEPRAAAHHNIFVRALGAFLG